MDTSHDYVYQMNEYYSYSQLIEHMATCWISVHNNIKKQNSEAVSDNQTCLRRLDFFQLFVSKREDSHSHCCCRSWQATQETS